MQDVVLNKGASYSVDGNTLVPTFHIQIVQQSLKSGLLMLLYLNLFSIKIAQCPLV